MSIKLFLLPYKDKSNSCKLLAKELKAKRIKLVNSKYKPKDNHYVINWGNAQAPDYVTFNKNTSVAGNKLLTFQQLTKAGVPIPEWTVNIEEARSWLPADVFGRKILTGHSGAGIFTFTGEEQAPLYVKYIKKRHEYRIHCGKNHVIDVQQKRKKAGVEHDNKIRNLQNGWIYARENVDPPQEIAYSIAKESIAALGLDFGAVDLIYNEKMNKYFVLEVNTAPGLQGTTVLKYKEFFDKLLQD